MIVLGLYGLYGRDPFSQISVQNLIDRFGSSENSPVKVVHLQMWSSLTDLSDRKYPYHLTFFLSSTSLYKSRNPPATSAILNLGAKLAEELAEAGIERDERDIP